MTNMSDHAGRFEKMRAEIDKTQNDLWYYHANPAAATEDVVGIHEFMKTLMAVGPFHQSFVTKDNKLRDEFYDIPLDYEYGKPPLRAERGIALIGHASDHSVILKSIAEVLKYPATRNKFEEYGLAVLRVRHASNHQGQSVVIGLELVTNLQPYAFYEHPTGGRMLLAMNGWEVPDQSALIMMGIPHSVQKPLDQAFMEATNLYNEHEFGNITDAELMRELYDFFH